MANRMVQPGQNQIPTSSSLSRQSTRMLNSTVKAVAAVAATSSVPHPPHAQSHPHIAVPLSPDSLVIRNLKKRMNRLNLNARTASSSGPLTATGADQSGATATTKTPVTAAATAAAAAAALTAAIASPAVISTPLSTHTDTSQGGWVPSGVEGNDYGEVQGEGYQRGQPGSGTGTGVGTIGGGMGYSTVAGTLETGSSPGLQYNYAQDHINRPPSYHYPDYQHQQQGYQEQFLQQQQQQYYQANQMHPSGDVQQWLHHGQHQAHQQYQQQQHQGVGVGAPDKAIRSSFLQGIKTHTLEPTQLTHLTLLRYEFLMNEFVEMMRLLPALQVLDLDVLSIPYCSCRTLAPPHNRQQQQLSRHRLHQHQRHQSLQDQDPSLVSQEHPYRAHPYTEAAYAWYSSQNDDSDDMDIDSDENNPASTAALCSNCIHREGLFFRNQGSTSTSGPQDQNGHYPGTPCLVPEPGGSRLGGDAVQDPSGGCRLYCDALYPRRCIVPWAANPKPGSQSDE
ncbi:hypothetical protein BGX24_011868 [Mortierella sp. AD032]|nr:hypothetical protein BGX24_011868 [Mortierella sp. AD032]